MSTIDHSDTFASPAQHRDSANNKPRYWLDRGTWVGLTLGASTGSIYPIIGTAIGAASGTGAGMTIGLLMAAFAAATRRFRPTDPKSIERRERVACLVIMWAPVLFVPPLAIPAVLGSIHAFAAGTPTAQEISTGEVSLARRRICHWMPGVILVIISIGWICYLLVLL